MSSLNNAGIAQLVEHDLAKVGVASSNLVSRSNFMVKKEPVDQALFFPAYIRQIVILAGWQSGYAPACKAVYTGSTPVPASKNQ